MARKTDQFANKFYGTVLESGANTLTFAEIPTNVDVFAKKAWVLHRLEWYLGVAEPARVASSDDLIQLALTSSNKMNVLTLGDAGVVDLYALGSVKDSGVGFELITMPYIRDFNNLPGGGLIIAPRPLYIAVKGTSLAAAVTASVRGYFTAIDLNADEYLELVDFYRIVQ